MAFREDLLYSAFDSAPSKAQQMARDYLLAERVGHRIRVGSVYACRIQGYNDAYYPQIVMREEALTTRCNCPSRHDPCRHVLALIADLVHSPRLYAEAPFRVVWHYEQLSPQDLLSSQAFPWHLVPKTPPLWTQPFSEASLTEVHLAFRKTSSRLQADPDIWFWAELHPSWLDKPLIQDQFDQWLALRRDLVVDASDARAWVVLHWMQPRLPLASIFAQQWPAFLTPLMACLFNPSPLREATCNRTRALLTDLTALSPPLADALWPMFRSVDPFRLHQADALYVAGYPDKAIALLHDHLPDDGVGRRQARERLVRWLDLREGLGHRLALAWDTRSLKILDPVRDLLSEEEWTTIAKALQDHAVDASLEAGPE